MVLAIDIDVGRLAQQSTPATAEQFDAAAYRDRLIAGGIDPTSAAEVAAKTAAARATSATSGNSSASKFEPRNGDLFDQLTQVGMPKKISADKKVATVPAVYSTARDLVPPKAARTKRDGKIVAVAAKISDELPSGEDMAFMHAIMCQVGLPRSRVGHKNADGKWVDAIEFERQCGGAALSVAAGKLWDGKQFVQQPIPYGALPRLMLAWMNTFAVRHKTPEIPVGNSVAEFLRILGKDTSGGKKGGYTVFRTQMQALSACRITLGFNAGGKAYTYDGKPIKQFEAWLNTHDSQATLWPGVVTFSEDYFRTLISHAVPLDVRALSALKGSALAMDAYTMLADRLHRITGRPVLLYWANLRNQFGQEYQGKEPDKDFKKKFLPALRDALAVYPQAKVKQVTGGLLLMSSPPPIPYKAT